MRAPLTPIKAFVHDAQQLAGANADSSANEARLSHWLAVAQAAERLGALTPEQRPAYLDALVANVLPPKDSRPTHVDEDREPVGALEKLAERLRVEAEDMERAGCFELALVTVSAVSRLLLNQGFAARMMAHAHMGRVFRQIGDLDTARDCYQSITADGRAKGDDPVAAHGFIGLGNVANHRGNRPEEKACFHKALELAKTGSATEMAARQGLMIIANIEHNVADALLHGWRAHDLAPPESEAQLSIIGLLARTALESEFYDAALSGFDYIIQRTKLVRIRLPVLGGAMRAGAAKNRRDLVERFEALGIDDAERGQLPFDSARFFLWSAESWHTLNAPAERTRRAEQAIQWADRFGFHQIRFAAEALISERATRKPKSPGTFEVTSWSADESSVVKTGIDRLVALSR